MNQNKGMQTAELILGTKLTVNDLKNAIWDCNNGLVPIGGMPPEWYRNELFKLTGETKGYHEM